MKAKRHAKILELIGQYAVNTQEELLGLLQKEGFEVTQATISRDIKELRLVKSMSSDGTYRYSVPHRGTDNKATDFNYSVIISEALREVDYAMNMVCVSCYKGLALAACAAFDEMHWNGFVGSLAGEDTFFILMRNEQCAKDLCQELKKYISR